MSTTNLNLENIFPSYELVDTVATKAEIADAIEVSGAADGDSFTINGITVSLVAVIGAPGADEVEIIRSGTTATDRDRVRNAINGVDATNTNIGYGSNLTAAEGIDGVNATSGTSNAKVSVATEVVGAYSLTLINVVGTNVTAAGATVTTGTAATGAVKIDLSDLDITDNALTVAETQDATGDYRQLIYHVIRKYQEYLDLQESVSTVTSSGGANYTVGDALVFTGGSPAVAASGTVATIDGSGNPATFNLSGGSGYTTAPTVSISSASATTVATVVATITDNAPDKLSVTKGSLTENASTGIITRAWTVSFGFNEAGLNIATD